MKTESDAQAAAAGWLLLIHQLPPQPSYFRVKIWRRLQALGAVAIKNAVYALPDGDAAHEDFQWLLREIEQGGGEGSICSARFVGGLSDGQIRELFRAARDADYAALATEAEAALAGQSADPGERRGQVARLRRRLDQIGAIDFFAAGGLSAAATAIDRLAAALPRAGAEPTTQETTAMPPSLGPLAGRRWVTRRDVHIDRIACAWLIRRFVDPDAHFGFVAARGHRPEPGELRFDMFEAEFTHDGDRCSFEVMRERFAAAEPGLPPISEIVHDIDFKDGKFGRPEAAGFATVIDSIIAAHDRDEARIERAAGLFDDLLAYFRRQAGA